MMRVLGVDPGSHVTGWGVVARDGGRLTHVASGTIRPPRSLDLPARLAHIYDALSKVIATHTPTQMAVESVFAARNPQAALKLGHARGVVLLAAAVAGVPVQAYAPARIKQAVTGTGRADKHQVQQMVRLLLSLAEVPARDAADALAVAICRCNDRDGPMLRAEVIR